MRATGSVRYIQTVTSTVTGRAFGTSGTSTNYPTNIPLSQSAKHICGIDILTNEQVNFVSMLITSVIAGWFVGPWYFQ